MMLYLLSSFASHLWLFCLSSFKRHQLGAVTNIAIASIYAIYCCCERFNSGGGFLDGANWFIYLSILSVLQFILVAVYWGIERIIKVCKSKSSKKFSGLARLGMSGR